MWALDGYEPLAELGRGSTGVVTRARESVTGAVVAVRRLALDLCDSPAFLVRYRGEVAMLGLIEHPQVAGVYELVERGNTIAVVTEYVDGVSLRDLIERTGPMEPEAALYVAKGVLLGLREVHARGIVHRALRPENVLIDSTGTVKIVDIGLTAPGRNRVPANPTYAAPELWSGAEPTPMSDVYAATAMLFECLGGQPPRSMGGAYVGGSAHAADDAIAALRPTAAPDPVRAHLAHGLAAEPAARPADAAAALERSDIAAFSAFGSRWYDMGHAHVRQRLARVRPPTATGAGATMVSANGSGPVTAPGNLSETTEEEPTAPVPPPAAAVPAPAVSAPAAAVPAPAVSAPVTAAGSAGADGVLVGRPPDAAADRAAAIRAAAIGETTPASGVSPPDIGPGLREATGAGDAVWAAPADDETPAGRRARRTARILVGVAILVLMAAGSGFVLRSAFGPGDGTPRPVTTNTHVPVAVPGPTVPAVTPGSDDTAKPSSPANLRVIGRSISAVSLDWGSARDDVGVAGYIVYRGGTQVGTTYQPGFTDTRLTGQTRYQYTVAAFDAAGNISAPSAAVVASTLAEPDVSPPSVPQNVASSGQTMTSVVLTWSASHDNVGVAGYEVYRDGTLVANVHRPGHTDKGLSAGTRYRYTVRAFDTSNNASADSGVAEATTLAAPDTTPPSVPTGVAATGTGPTTIAVSWSASSDNVGVTGYRVYRDDVRVAEVTGTTFTDQGLTPSTTYGYRVRAVDAEDNESALSGTATASTSAEPTTPPPTTTPPPPTPEPSEVESVTLHVTNTDCVVSIQVTVDVTGPMDVTLTYTITGGGSDTVPLHFTDGAPQTLALPDGNGSVDGSAQASAGPRTQVVNWSACEPPPPPTTDPPPPDDD